MFVKLTGGRVLVTISLILGGIALGLAAMPFILVPGGFLAGMGSIAEYRFGRVGPRFWIDSWIFGWPGLILAVNALIRSQRVDGDRNLKRLAALSLGLSLFVIVAALLLALNTRVVTYPHPVDLPDYIPP